MAQLDYRFTFIDVATWLPLAVQCTSCGRRPRLHTARDLACNCDCLPRNLSGSERYELRGGTAAQTALRKPPSPLLGCSFKSRGVELPGA